LAAWAGKATGHASNGCATRIAVVIPPKSNRKDKRECDFIFYKERNLTERLFGKFKQFRAIATRDDKLAIRLVAAVIQFD
jgi:transposase